ncbi:MAG TPA: tRNA pseudouridine(13) synthase TruD [Woeseiaceae bacterium]|nr:tRNA pseudouridine(13) synthase TruD [Woeseiaceae bacterium]
MSSSTPPGDRSLPDWRRAWGGPLIQVRLRSSPEDFQVTERLAFEFTGDGEHDVLWIEKSGANTVWVARNLAKYAGVALRDVGYAGLKDRNAVTRQWYSVRRPTAAGTDWPAMHVPGVRLLASSRNQRKLRPGAHAGNAFRIALRGVSAIDPPLLILLERCRNCGVPNYFGEQRFGLDGNNIGLARAFFAGKKLKREDRSMAISAARSLLFNRLLEFRVSAGTWNSLQPGDFANLDGSGSLFAVDELDQTLLERCRSLDIHPTALLWGRAVKGSTDTRPACEDRVAEEYPDLAAGLEMHAEQSRRALRLAVREFSWSLENDVLWLEFFLARGGFATAVLREIATY